MVANRMLFERLDGVAACWLPKNMVNLGCIWMVLMILKTLSWAIIRIRDEEIMMRASFGKEWEDYHARTKRLISGIIWTWLSIPKSTSIRILKLFPLGRYDDEFNLYKPIHRSIEVNGPDELPVYDALSYTWSDPSALYPRPTDVLSPEEWVVPAWLSSFINKGLGINISCFIYLKSFVYLQSRLIRKHSTPFGKGKKQ